MRKSQFGPFLTFFGSVTRPPDFFYSGIDGSGWKAKMVIFGHFSGFLEVFSKNRKKRGVKKRRRSAQNVVRFLSFLDPPFFAIDDQTRRAERVFWTIFLSFFPEAQKTAFFAHFCQKVIGKWVAQSQKS